MLLIDSYLADGLNVKKPFVVHEHTARKSGYHYDLRIGHPKNPVLLSFAIGKEFKNKLNDKIIVIRTRDHPPRWLTLESYRLTVFDRGIVYYRVFTNNYIELEFQGVQINGLYKIFKMKNSRRNDVWMFSKIKDTKR